MSSAHPPSEHSSLAPYAMNVNDSRGRKYSELPHPYRNDYARDRDRVVHSRAFRRLEAKTQVFTTRYSDHFRNRLTHTLEVAQIARTVAGALNLNTDLAEALALVHDIGHPPFGHAGEHRLNQLMGQHQARFDHNLHALHIVESFEQRYLAFPGLNLTFEVREGIVKHSRDYSESEYPELAEYLLDQAPPLEAQLIDWADEIAYNTADLDDGVEAGILDIDQILHGVPLIYNFYHAIRSQHSNARPQLIFNESLKRALDYFATDLIETTRRNIINSGVQSVADVRRNPHRLAGFAPDVARASRELKRFLKLNLYDNPAIAEDRDRGVNALDELFRHYMAHPESMPPFYAAEATAPASAGGRAPHLVVLDYVAGMTDHFLLRTHRELIK